MRALTLADLDDATRVLADSCAFDRADVVAREKLFGAGPTGTPQAIGAWDGDALDRKSVV